MFCENCGAKLADNAKFCTECGTKVTPVAVEEKAALVVEKAAEVVEEKVAPVVEKAAAKVEEAKASTSEAVTGAVAVGGAAAGAVVAAGEKVAEAAEKVAGVKAEAVVPQATEVKPAAMSAREEILRMGASKEKGKKPVNATPAPVPAPGSSNHGNGQPQQSKGIFEEYFEEIKKFNCNGRLNRLKYWKFVGVNFIFVFVVATILGTVGVGDKILKIFSSIMSILFIPFSIRRLHDLNKSGWFLLISLIPVINFFFGIYAGFFKGTEGPNDYGDDPLAGKY